jgi:hypothetical protein
MTSEGWSSQRLYRPFISASVLVAVLLGFSTGAAILIMPMLGMDRNLTWVTHSQSHGIAQLFGWAGLFIMGFAYHVVPRFFNSSIRYPLPQKLSMWFVIAGLLFRFSGQSMYKTSFADPMLVVGGVLLLAGMLVFGWTLLHVIRLSSSKSGPAEIWLISGIAWSVVAAALHLLITVRMTIDSAPLGYAPWNEALIYTALFGFISSFIFGVSARAIRGFLLLKPMHERLNTLSVGLIQLGLITLIIGRFADLDQNVASTGLIVASMGAICYVIALRVLEPASGPVRRYAVGYERYDWLIRTAYGWLAIGSIMLILTALDEASVTDVMPIEISLPVMHIFTLGFVTTLIVGAASSFITVFEGSDIRHPWLMDAASLCITISVLLRVVFGFSVSEIGENALGASGGVGLIGIILFAIVAFQAMTESARAAYTARAAEFGRIKFQATKSPVKTPINLG